MRARYAILLPPLLLHAADARVPVARFSAGDLEGWQEKAFAGHTDYRLTDTARGTVLRAQSDASASGLYRELRVDLGQTPYLHWSWRVDGVLRGNDEHRKAGDDYPARVYVVFSGGLFFWNTRAINYVWSSHQPEGSTWPNAFTGNARMVAVRSGAARAGEWLAERRDVRADYRRLFGEEPGNADAVAIMTDTDDSGGEAVAWYGDIWFAGE